MNRANFVNPMNKVIIATTRKQYLKLLFRPAFKRQKQFRNEVIAIEKEKCTKNLKKPIYIGTKKLDLCKVLMQVFHYDYTKIKYGDQA